MQIINVVQGSPEWLSARGKYHTASEAPAMMGASKYQTRADLLKAKATGHAREVDAATQMRFDNGHAVENLARPLVEAMIGEELFPATAIDDAGFLLASFDGLTMDESTAFEHKAWNKSLVAQVQTGELEPHYFWQLEQQLAVSGAEKVVFVCSDGTPENFVSMEYRAVPGRREKLLAGWKQFASDLRNYEHVEATPTPTAAPQETLPAVSVQVTGAIAIIDNLNVFGRALADYVAKINKAPQSDDDFATLEAQVKVLKGAEDALTAAENNALGQAADIDALRRTVANYKEIARQARLTAEKVVKAEKENRKNAIIQKGIADYRAFIKQLEGSRFDMDFKIPDLPVDFIGAAKGLKTIASVQNAVGTELARAKIDASAIADKVAANIKTILSHSELRHLFVDYRMLVLKEQDDLAAVIAQRISAFRAEQQRKEAELREKIRLEEEAKAADKIKAELAALEAQRIAEQKAAEEKAKTDHATVSHNGASNPPDFSKDPPLPAAVVAQDPAPVKATAMPLVAASASPLAEFAGLLAEVECALSALTHPELQQVAHFIDRLQSIRPRN